MIQTNNNDVVDPNGKSLGFSVEEVSVAYEQLCPEDGQERSLTVQDLHRIIKINRSAKQKHLVDLVRSRNVQERY